MLISPDHKAVVSHLGWVDKSSLWVYDMAKDNASLIPLGNAKYLTLYPCKNPNQFAALHHSDGALIRITVHTFENPAIPLCTIEHSGDKTQVEGNVSALQNAPRYYVAYYNPGYNADFHLISLDFAQAKIETDRFDWYDNSYDKGYQGIVGIIELSSGELIVSIQRDSHPIIYDPKRRTIVRKLSLADRHGNPKFRFAKQRKELWADDYDTILKFDSETLNMKGSRRLQMASQSTAEFIGDWSFDEEESLCLVSRPFSGDIIAISTNDLKTKYIVKAGKQPLEAVFLNGGKVIARDWKTGELLKGSLKRNWFG